MTDASEMTAVNKIHYRACAQDAMAPAVDDGAGGPVRRKQSRRGTNKLSGPARQDRRRREGDDGE